ncbi:MAG: carboxypeptidase-like regulatory domain-containing protein [Silvibacterium sp.]
MRKNPSPWKWAVLIICLPCAAQPAQVNTESQSANENASISGTVQNEAGVLEDARVSVFQLVTAEGWGRLARKCSVETDSNGSYRCTGLAPGKYIVLASAGAQLEKQSKSKEQASPYAFFPSTTDLEDAAEVVVRAGQLQSADIFIGRADLYTVSCKIGSRPRYVNARLLARTNGRDGMLLADTGIRGSYDGKHGEVRFERVPHGNFEAVARWRVGREFHFSEADVAVQAADVTDLSLEERQPVSLEGYVTVDSGSKVALSTAVLERAFETDAVPEPATISTQVSGNGYFRFPSVLPGRYFLKVIGDPQVFVESSTVAGLSKNGSLLVIGNSAENLTVQVDASTQIGSIGGVVDDLPESNPRAGVLVQSEDTGQIFTTTTGQSGKFMISGLGPGDYRIYSWPDLAHMAYRDPSVLSQYADSAGEVVLQDGAMNQIMNVNLIQGQ